MNQYFVKIGGFFDRAITFLGKLASWLPLVIMLIVCLEVTMRYFFGNPISWAVEVSEFSIWFITFLGMAWLLKEEGHVNVEFLLDFLTPKNRNLLNFLTSMVGAAMCLAMFVYGAQSTWIAFEIGRVTRTAMMVKQWPLLIVLPVCFFFLFIQFIRRSIDFFKRWRRPEAE